MNNYSRSATYPFYIKAHKIILASASAYFRALFAGGFRENSLNQAPLFEALIDSQITYPILKLIVDFIYTNSIEIKAETVQDLLMASKLLQVDDIVNACCVFLYLNMDSSNCIGIKLLAKQLGCVSLYKKAECVWFFF